MYAITLPWSLSTSSLAAITIMQYALHTAKQGIDCLKGGQDPDSLKAILQKAQRFCEVLNAADKLLERQKEPAKALFPQGMDIAFRYYVALNLCHPNQ